MFLLKAFGPEEIDSQLILVLYAADHGGGPGRGRARDPLRADSEGLHFDLGSACVCRAEPIYLRLSPISNETIEPQSSEVLSRLRKSCVRVDALSVPYIPYLGILTTLQNLSASSKQQPSRPVLTQKLPPALHP